MFRIALSIVATVVAASLAPTFVGAAEPAYPTRPIRILIPVTPGGGVDAVGRLLAHKLTGVFNQQVIVDNRPGAGGNLASDIAAKANPDGHTLVVVTAAHVTNPSLYKKLPYDPVKDFAPITKLSIQPYILVLSPNVPSKDLKEFVAFAKGKPGGISYASAGTGLLGHLSMELFKSVARFEGQHIPYKGASPALIDLLGGRVDAFFSTITSGLPQVKAGKLRAVATTGARRSPQLPDLPTVAEQGYPGYEVISWYALLAAAGTPPAVVKRLNDETVKILKTPEVKQHMATDGAEPDWSTPEELSAYIKSEIQRWAKVIKESGASAE